MITVSQNEFIQNPSAVSQLAKGEPVLVAGADKQVLMDYGTYQQLAEGKNLVDKTASLADLIGYTPASDIEIEFGG